MPKKTEKLEIRLSYEKKQAFREACIRSGRSASDVLRGFIADALAPQSRIAQVKRKVAAFLSNRAGLSAFILAIAIALPAMLLLARPDPATSEAHARLDAIRQIPSDSVQARVDAWRNLFNDRSLKAIGEQLDIGGNISVSLDMCKDGRYRYYYLSKNERSLAAGEKRAPRADYIAGKWNVLPSRDGIVIEATAETGERGEFYILAGKGDIIDIGGNLFTATTQKPEFCG